MLSFILPLLLISPVFSTESCDLETKELTNLWKVSSDTGTPSYFFGTLHLPYTRLWQGISEQAKSAFQSADQLYLEKVGGHTEMADCRFLPDNKKLADMLSPELMRRLRDHMDWLRTKIPSWLSLRQNISGFNYDTLTNNWEMQRPHMLR